jgi:hypothetical protein
MLAVLAMGLGCDTEPPHSGEPAPDSAPEAEDSGDSALPARWSVNVQVTLDGVPVEGALVGQGGSSRTWLTDADGRATVEIDGGTPGDFAVVASHPEARTWWAPADEEPEQEIALTRFDPSDNPDYPFADPGGPDVDTSTADQCSHCHRTLHEAWYASPHRTAASNPVVHDVYGGAASVFTTAEACAMAGGRWEALRVPGTGAWGEGCRLGDDVPTTTGGTGGCADCHAPGIDGELGGRDLLDATGLAYDAGVHCDVCHHVESVDMEAPPGVGGRLHIVRPSETSSSPALGEWLPLTFGPFADVPNIRMGSVPREIFHSADLCGGCHESTQAALVPGAEVDRARWPEGVLPIHSTWSEWVAGPMNPAAPCQSCHMPPRADVGNAADLYNAFDHMEPGVTSGWERPPGEVREHAWWGPRQRESGMLELAAALWVDTTLADGVLTAEVTVKNVGPGHAIPTGEPLRSLVLHVEARCGGALLEATGGTAIPDFGGWLERKEAGEDWSRWSTAQAGQVVRVVRRTGEWLDYAGYGPFGDGSFDAQAKGMPVEEVVGEATIVAVDDGAVQFDVSLPDGDVAYLGWPAALPEDGDEARPVAGAPGFAFARVLVGADGTRMVPHHLAVDVASDNRLLPQASWTSQHQFAADCTEPEVRAVLVHRAWPVSLATERGWPLTESVMAEGAR